MRLNPRFDGAFLNSKSSPAPIFFRCLNPRFDGAFLNYTGNYSAASNTGLNPRFDGAFLIHEIKALREFIQVLIPDLMGLF